MPIAIHATDFPCGVKFNRSIDLDDGKGSTCSCFDLAPVLATASRAPPRIDATSGGTNDAVVEAARMVATLLCWFKVCQTAVVSVGAESTAEEDRVAREEDILYVSCSTAICCRQGLGVYVADDKYFK